MDIIKRSLILLTIISIFNGMAFGQPLLNLDDYLRKVEQNNAEMKSIGFSIEALGKKVLELDMVYSPYLSGGYTYLDDKSGSDFGSSLPVDKLTAHSWNINATKKFSFGSTVTVGYAGANAAYDLLSSYELYSGYTTTHFNGYQMKPFVQVQQSLLRDFNSGLTQSGIDKSKAATRAAQFGLLFRKQQILQQARAAYWALSLAREVVIFRKISLERADTLLQWSDKRKRLDLAEQNDLLQVQAAYKARQLNLLMANEDEVRAARTFNELLGISAETVTYELERFQDKVPLYIAVKSLTHSGERADVLAARANYASSEYADRETYYRSMPELSLVGSYASNGLALNSSDAWSDVAGINKPTLTVGLSVLIPLDYRTLNKVRDGYKKDFYSAKEALKNAELSARKDWDNLSRTWKDIKARLLLAQELQKIQESRVQEEKNLLQKGRTTMFQVITAANDLDDATLNVYRNVYEAIVTKAQSELYNTKQSDIGGK